MLAAICWICFFEWVRAFRLFGRNLLTEIIVTRGGDIESSILSNGAVNHLRNCRYDPIRIAASIGR
jgi:hypothetical protein